MAMAQRIADRPPIPNRLVKGMVYRGMSQSLDEHLVEAASSDHPMPGLSVLWRTRLTMPGHAAEEVEHPDLLSGEEISSVWRPAAAAAWKPSSASSCSWSS